MCYSILTFKTRPISSVNKYIKIALVVSPTTPPERESKQERNKTIKKQLEILRRQVLYK